MLETTFTTATGTVTAHRRAGHRAATDDRHAIGADAPPLLVRALACTDGEVEVAVDYAPRPEYGLVVPLLTRSTAASPPAAAPTCWCSPALPSSTSPVRPRPGGCGSAAGEPLPLGLQHRTHGRTVARSAAGRASSTTRCDATVDAWRSWSGLHQAYDGPWRDLVHHSGRVLQALTFQPTGAIVAAATTSLPESVGGERNWDYRYSWVRDASFTMEALWVAACPDEADEFFDFMATAPARSGAARDLQIMFGVGGEHDLTERELPHLAGWRDSRPVRVGNGAWDQRQIDVYGELLGAAHRLADQLDPDHPATPGGSWSPAPTPPRAAGRRRTRASGRCAASRATSCTPR